MRFHAVIAASLAVAWPVATRGDDAQVPRLVLSTKDARLFAPGKEPQSFRSLEELVRAARGLRGEFTVEVGEASASREVLAEAHEDRKGKPVKVAAGDVPLIEIARALADTTGLPVIHDSTDRGLADRTVSVTAAIDGAGYELLKKLLEASHFRVVETTLEDGSRALLLESLDAAAPATEPVPRPVVVLGGDARPAPLQEPGRRRIRTPAGDSGEYAGVVLEEVPEALRVHLGLEKGAGLLVVEVDELKARRSRGLALLKRLDVVTRVNDAAVTSAEAFVSKLSALKQDDLLEIRVLRRGTLTILHERPRSP